MTQSVEEFIEHVGVKGMRWGVRKSSSRTSSDYRKAAPLRKKKVSELTNKQLKTANERANLETNFRRLNPGKIAKGEHAAKQVIALVGTSVAIVALATKAPAAIKAGEAIVKKILKQQASRQATRAIVKKGQQRLF